MIKFLFKYKIMTTYTLNACKNLIDQYLKVGGEVIDLEEGSLGLGKLLLIAKGKKTTIIQEVFLNAWSSGHTVRMYNKTPKKYQEILNKL